MPPDSLENNQIDTPVLKKKYRFTWFKILFVLFAIFLTSIFVLYSVVLNLNQPADAFPVNQIITISEGTSVREITTELAKKGVVRSETILYYSLILFHDPTAIKASSYVFDEPLTTAEVASRLTEGDFDTDLVSFTHFEGERVTSIANRASVLLPEFDAEAFIVVAEPLEGRLFPDTYFIPPTFTEQDLLNLMLDTFTERMNKYQSEINEHYLTLDQILVLASIIEREANTPESMRLVSSVLQNRIEIGMPLQADASIEYVLDKPLSELTPADLDIDSPYNTYLYNGLPPTPIGNPGEDSILAVLRPEVSDYFYYITDDTGTFHFSETYNQHLRNIEIYLR